MSRFSLRWILLWPIVLTVSIGFVALGLYVERTVHDDQLATVDDELQRVDRRGSERPPSRPTDPADTADTAGTDDPADTTADADVLATGPIQLVVGTDGVLLDTLAGESPFTTAELARLAGLDDTVTLGSDPRYRALATPGADGTTLVSALPLDQLDASMASLRSSLIVGGLVVFAIVGGVVMLIATVVTRPVTTMSRTANLIADGALDTPIAPASGSRETADLATDLEQMVARLTSSIDDATRARDDLRRFLADASHELRTPLTTLRGYSDLYAHDMLDDPGHLDRAMERIGKESTRLTDMVNDMLQLASGEAAADTRVDTVDLVAVARDVVDDLSAAHPDHRIDVRCATTPIPTVDGDPARLHQGVLNLVANACRYGGETVDVVVDEDADDEAVTVSVIDHGPGVAPDVADKVFLPFFRGDASRARDGDGGAGLGLALVAQIATQHGGRVSLTPTAGGGATFVLHVPRGSRRGPST